MIARRQLIDWFEDPDRRGVASNAELASLLDQTESFVRTEGRGRDVRRIGSAMAWSLDDALELYDDLDEQDDDELPVARDLDPDDPDEQDDDEDDELDELDEGDEGDEDDELDEGDGDEDDGDDE